MPGKFLSLAKNMPQDDFSRRGVFQRRLATHHGRVCKYASMRVCRPHKTPHEESNRDAQPGTKRDNTTQKSRTKHKKGVICIKSRQCLHCVGKGLLVIYQLPSIMFWVHNNNTSLLITSNDEVLFQYRESRQCTKVGL